MSSFHFWARRLTTVTLLRYATLAACLSACLAIASCSEKMMPANVTGYNHMGHFAVDFTVNKAVGGSLSKGTGGGYSCCVLIPVQWRPGLKAKIVWQYDQAQDDDSPLPAPQEVEVDVPEYKRSGNFQVHFYQNHKVKVVVSNCSLGHPFYPMKLADQLPWSPEYSREAAIEITRQGGMSNDC